MKAKKATLRVVQTKKMQPATFQGSDATADATHIVDSDLKKAAARVLARNTGCNSRATRCENTALTDATLSGKKLRAQSEDDISAVIADLADIGLYRDGSQLCWRNTPRQEQHQLLRTHGVELKEYLSPRLVLKI